jgi:hypothetical protein
MLIGQDFYGCFAEETISIDLVSTQKLEEPREPLGSSRFCVISLIDIGSIDLCVLCVFVVRSTPSLGEMYLRIHFTHQSWESRHLL